MSEMISLWSLINIPRVLCLGITTSKALTSPKCGQKSFIPCHPCQHSPNLRNLGDGRWGWSGREEGGVLYRPLHSDNRGRQWGRKTQGLEKKPTFVTRRANVSMVLRNCQGKKGESPQDGRNEGAFECASPYTWRRVPNKKPQPARRGGRQKTRRAALEGAQTPVRMLSQGKHVFLSLK